MLLDVLLQVHGFRESIRHIALREPKLLDSIGIAQMEQEIQKRLLAATRKTQELMTEETGIQSSLSEDDMKLYLQQVIGGQTRKSRQEYKTFPVNCT
jgi:hypothetical protein